MSLGQDKERAGEHAYGSHFTYDGCWALPAAACGYMPAVLLNLAYLFGLAIFVLLPEIVRWVLQWFMPRSGEGPSERLMESGFLEATNYTSFVLSDGMSEVHVKTVLRGRGDPGYLLTSSTSCRSPARHIPRFDCPYIHHHTFNLRGNGHGSRACIGPAA
ncbi:hypothetical protein AcW1_003405 [Taiwanofungus camphoratus]|nr:hypothetical protein AcV5_002135 [Antrodia cinnamomea]KAI0941532.1 hypothetical protein AcW1_003405 [Antrodia cinnamomea]